MVISSKRTIFPGGFNFSKEIYKSEKSLNSGISLHGDGERGQSSSSSSSEGHTNNKSIFFFILGDKRTVSHRGKYLT